MDLNLERVKTLCFCKLAVNKGAFGTLIFNKEGHLGLLERGHNKDRWIQIHRLCKEITDRWIQIHRLVETEKVVGLPKSEM